MKTRTTLDDLLAMLAGFINQHTVFQITLSSPQLSRIPRRVTLRMFAAKEGLRFSVALWDGKQERHQTLTPMEATEEERWQQWLAQYKQVLISTSLYEYQIFSNRDGSLRMLTRASGKKVELQPHNRTKSYSMPEGEPVPFLVALGLMTPEGKVVRARHDKFRQINRFLEFIEDVLDDLPASGTLHIVDFGCGRSYLTFAMHWLLTEVHRRTVHIVGLDLNSSVIQECEQLAQKLQLEGLHFSIGDIATWNGTGNIDMVVSLHACDTATDAALAQALRWQSKVIFAVPCCQHQLQHQLESSSQGALLHYGLFRERTGAFVTDALRAAALEAIGWSCQVVEFIDMDHTPKNILLRAVRGQPSASAAKRYRDFRAAWGVKNFALEEYLDVNHRAFLQLEAN